MKSIDLTLTDRRRDGQFVAMDLFHLDGHHRGIFRDESHSRCPQRVSLRVGTDRRSGRDSIARLLLVDYGRHDETGTRNSDLRSTRLQR